MSTADAEVTLETNPETVTVERMRGFRAAGVNRVSLGVQSLIDEELQRLGRTHSSLRAREAVADVRAAGFDNVSLDLMMWLPQQGMRGVADHGRWPHRARARSRVALPARALSECAAAGGDGTRAPGRSRPTTTRRRCTCGRWRRLEASGYAQYEISNVARPGRESRHNLKYWRDGAWLGFGCGAHSTRGAAAMEERRRHHRVRRHVWPPVASVSVERQTRTPQEQLEDALFTGLRLVEGVDLDALGTCYGVDVWGRYGDALRPHIDAGRLLLSDGTLRLTREGMLVANDVMTVFV